jgi:ribokinase
MRVRCRQPGRTTGPVARSAHGSVRGFGTFVRRVPGQARRVSEQLDAVVVGQIARDLVLVVDEVPEAGTATPVRRRREMLGGKGANQAVGLAQLGVRVALLGVAGTDETGEWLLAQARRDGIDVSQVVRRGESGLIVDIVDGDGRWRYLGVPARADTARRTARHGGPRATAGRPLRHRAVAATAGRCPVGRTVRTRGGRPGGTGRRTRS